MQKDCRMGLDWTASRDQFDFYHPPSAGNSLTDHHHDLVSWSRDRLACHLTRVWHWLKQKWSHCRDPSTLHSRMGRNVKVRWIMHAGTSVGDGERSQQLVCYSSFWSSQTTQYYLSLHRNRSPTVSRAFRTRALQNLDGQMSWNGLSHLLCSCFSAQVLTSRCYFRASGIGGWPLTSGQLCLHLAQLTPQSLGGWAARETRPLQWLVGSAIAHL